jgi:hypothetical protein
LIDEIDGLSVCEAVQGSRGLRLVGIKTTRFFFDGIRIAVVISLLCCLSIYIYTYVALL